MGASQSGANTYFVDSRENLDENFINNLFNLNIKQDELNTYKNNKLNVLIPMAGAGSRFAEQGYVFPKPLIEIKGSPMIEVVVKNLNIDANYIFIVQKEHVEKYNIDKMLKLIKRGSKIVVTEGLTEGAACTTLLAKEHIDNENPLIISNSDQFILWIHCKNFDVLNYLISEQNNLNFFWHENDDYTLTSKNYIWTYPSKHFFENSVLVYLESDFKISENQKIYGICTDYPKAYNSVE